MYEKETYSVRVSITAELNASTAGVSVEIVDRFYVSIQTTAVDTKNIVVFSNSHGAVASDERST